jgi:predicted enzyme related to lactoylglutathione lyase
MIVVEQLQTVNLPAPKLAETIEFYNLFFDFELIEQHEDFAILSFDNLRLKLIATEDSASNKAIPTLSFLLDVDDFTDAIQEIESNQTPVVTGPVEITGGETIHINDPSGNIIELFYQE